MIGEITPARPFPDDGRGRRYPTTVVDAAFVGDVEELERATNKWGVGGRLACIGLELVYLILRETSLLFGEDVGRVHTVYCQRGGDVAFRAGERHVEGGSRSRVDTVEEDSDVLRAKKGSAGEDEGWRK